MKRVLMICSILVMVLIFVGCSENKKVNVDFIIDGTLYSIEINKGNSININDIPSDINQKNIKLYYKDLSFKEYKQEPIESDTEIFVLDKELENKIKEIFIEKNKEDLKNVSISELELRPIFIDNNIWVLFIDGGFYYTQQVTSEKISDIVIGYSSGQRLLVYKENNLYTLNDAFTNGVISYDILLEISKIQSSNILGIDINQNNYKNEESKWKLLEELYLYFR